MYFNAVILDEKLGEDNAREIKKLETMYQMGMDEKLGYNALEKYLQIQDLKDNCFEFNEIADFMNQDLKDIKKYWEVKVLMDEYLSNLGYEDMYTRLKDAEDWFWKLQESIARFDLSKGKSASTQPEWTYKKQDVNDLKLIMFDYIRASREAKNGLLNTGQSYRSICSAGKTGFFKRKDIWEKFSKKHFEDTLNIEEPTVDDYRKSHPDEELSEILKVRDKEYEKKVSNSMKENFGKTESSVNTENDKSEPKNLLEDALQKLEAIDDEGDAFLKICQEDSSIKELLVKIGQEQFRLKKKAESIDTQQ